MTQNLLRSCCAALACAAAAVAAPQQRPELAVAADGSMGSVTATAALHFTSQTARLQVHGSGEFGLHLDGWRRGALIATTGAVEPRRATASRVHYPHDGVVERYEVTANGFEQSFVLEQRPAGTGDLVLTVAVTGDATATRRAARHAPIDFTSGDGTTIRYGSAVAFERGGEPVPVASGYDGRGHIELVVPAALLEHATYPLTIDPLVAPVFDVYGTANTNSVPERETAVARSDADDTYMVVFTDRDYWLQWSVNYRIYRADGTSVGAGSTFASGPSSKRVAVTAAGGRYVVAWDENGVIRGMVANANGSWHVAPTQWSAAFPGDLDRRPALAGNQDGSFVLGWDHTPAGSSNPTEIRVQHGAVGSGAVTLGPVRLLESVTAGGHVEGIALARSTVKRSAGGWQETRAVWSRWYTSPAPGDFDVRTASFRIRAPTIGGTFVVLDGPDNVNAAAAIGPSETHPDVAMITQTSIDPVNVSYLVVWDVGGNVRGQRYDPLQTVGLPIDIEVGGAVSDHPSVGGGACEYTVAYQTGPSTQREIRAARVLPTGVMPLSHQPVHQGTHTFANIYRAPSITSRPPRSTPVDVTNRSLIVADYSGTSSPLGLGGSDTFVRAAFWEPVGYATNQVGAPCPGPNGELPTIGTNGDAYPGSTDFEVTLSDAPPNTIAVLLISDQFTTAPLPGAPGCTAYLGLPVLLSFAALTNAGDIAQPLAIPCSAPNGFSIAMQWLVFTPGHNPFGWITSDDMDIDWSHF